MTVSKLLPCPFCGGDDIFMEPDEYGSGGQWVYPVHVGCSRCKVEIVCVEAETQEEAVAAWNTRAMKAAEPLQQGDEVERLIDELVLASWQEGGPSNVARLEKAKAAIRAALVRSRLPVNWEPLTQDAAECLLKDCLEAMVLPEDDKALIDQLRLRGLWVFCNPDVRADAAITAIGSQSIEGERG